MANIELVAIIIILMHPTVADIGAYTSFVNLEKLYTLEDELVTIADVLLKHERHEHGDVDVHGINNVTSTVEMVKNIHRDVISSKNLTLYLVQPINIFHIVKRLSRDWQNVIATLEQSKSCSKLMQMKIDNMSDNVPTGKHLELIIKSILRLQVIYNITAKDVMSGHVINEIKAPFSLDDAFDLARVAYDVDQCFLAVDWLKFVMSHYDKETASFNLTNVMNLLASAYFKLGQPRAALATLDSLLEIDPSNIVAKRNIKFMLTKIDSGMKDADVTTAPVKTKREAMLRKHCTRDKKALLYLFLMDKARENMFCTYINRRDRRGIFDKPSVKTEVLSLRPLVLVFRDIVNASEQKAVAHLGYERMRDIMYKTHYMFPNGLDGTTVQDTTYWKWIEKIKENLMSIHLSYPLPIETLLLVKNIGMEGYKGTLLDERLTLLGTFFVYLSEPKYAGGDVVFPYANLKVAPDKGSVIYFERTLSKQMAVCPLIADTEWVGLYNLQVRYPSDICYKDDLIRPQRL